MRMKTITVTKTYSVSALQLSNHLKINCRPRVAEFRPNSPTYKSDVKPHLLRSLLVKKLSFMYGGGGPNSKLKFLSSYVPCGASYLRDWGSNPELLGQRFTAQPPLVIPNDILSPRKNE
ncbi:hypothetical protein ElyMa_001183400 [Elysia marginata]|uniref:Uncharacterized protein n=1 Tax=Elysia marginata TaxID=1093978 RepID=A0AAV4I3Z1_9GAST|nr:hypothetical protein ElyMa_001183400 [Elysia marginata]